MNSHRTQIVLAWLVCSVAACTSTSIRYYTLMPAPQKLLRVPEQLAAIDVRVVYIPAQLDRAELMVRTGPTETMLLENERWASPMRDEIKNALRIELERRLGAMAGRPCSFAKLTVDIDVQRFEAQLGRYALLEASWRASSSSSGESSPNGQQVATGAFRADEEIRDGYAAMVDGYQRGIATLADAILAVVRSSACEL